MKQVIRHVITKEHEHYKECDKLTLLSKNLYNQALYRIRQHYFNIKRYNKNVDNQKTLQALVKECNYFNDYRRISKDKSFKIEKHIKHNQLAYRKDSYISNYTISKQMQNENQVDYRALPAQCSQQVLKKLNENFMSFFKALKDYKKNPSKYKGRPKIPGYLDKESGRFITEYTYQQISKKEFNKGYVKLAKSNIKISIKNINYADLACVRIIPKSNYFVIEIIHNVQEQSLKQDNNKYASIDLGVNNLATVTFNTGDRPLIININGKPLKSINQFFNKKKAEIQTELEKKNKRKTSNRLSDLSRKREHRINDYMHKASRKIVDNLIVTDVNTLVIGKNKEWKQDVNMGAKNNQNFVSIPFNKLISMLEYKCKLVGINVVIQEESYTSKCSFLDNEPIQKHARYLGNRKHRGLFISSKGVKINADINGSANIMRKAFPNALANGAAVTVVNPIKIKCFY